MAHSGAALASGSWGVGSNSNGRDSRPWSRDSAVPRCDSAPLCALLAGVQHTERSACRGLLLGRDSRPAVQPRRSRPIHHACAWRARSQQQGEAPATRPRARPHTSVRKGVAKSPLAARREWTRTRCRHAPRGEASPQGCGGDGSTLLRVKPTRTRRVQRGESRELHTVKTVWKAVPIAAGERCERPRAPCHHAPRGQASPQGCVGDGSTSLRVKPARTRRIQRGERRCVGKVHARRHHGLRLERTRASERAARVQGAARTTHRLRNGQPLDGPTRPGANREPSGRSRGRVSGVRPYHRVRVDHRCCCTACWHA